MSEKGPTICNPAMVAAASQMKGLRDSPSKAERVRERQLKKWPI